MNNQTACAISDPFDRAWAQRDAEALVALMSPDVKLHSPLLTPTFSGREAARELYSVLFATLGTITFVEDFRADGRRFILWHAQPGQDVIEGADFIRWGSDGLIEEIRVFIRPLAGIASFASLTARPLGARRGRLRGAAAGILSRPMRPVFGLLDRVAPGLIPMGPHSAGSDVHIESKHTRAGADGTPDSRRLP